MGADPLVDRLRAAGCVFAEEEAALLRAEATGDDLEALVVRRTGGEPLEQVVGWAELAGVRVRLRPGVFVPRQRSALLVAAAVDRAPPGAVVVDLGCGSGAVGAAVLARRPDVSLWAADLSPAAVACARLNLTPDRVVEGDLFDPLPAALRGRVAVVAAHVPYVPTAAIAAMPPEARDHEERIALDGGVDGLDVVRRVAAAAPGWLAPGGALLVETSVAQAPVARAVLATAGLEPRVLADDELGATVVVGRRPEGGAAVAERRAAPGRPGTTGRRRPLPGPAD